MPGLESRYKMFDNGDIRLKPNYYALRDIAPTFDPASKAPSTLADDELNRIVGFYTWICHQTHTHPEEHMIGIVNAWLGKDPVAISLGRWTEAQETGSKTSILLSMEVTGGHNPRIYQATSEGMLMVNKLPGQENQDRTYRNEGLKILLEQFKQDLSPTPPK